MKDQSPKLRSMKPLFLLSGGALVVLVALVGFSLLPAFPNGEESIARTAIFFFAVASAYVAERFAQFAAGVSLVWSRPEGRRVALFVVYLLIWAGALSLSWTGLLESRGLLAFAIDAAVMYMFAAALFEILNLLKNGVDK